MAVRILEDGGVVAYPTEAVYGLGCVPECRKAVYRLLRLKKRQMAKGLILVAASAEQLDKYVQFRDLSVKERVLATWPGPVTWLLPAKRVVPDWIKGNHATVAVRVSGHPVVNALCRDAGVLVSTSANPEHMPPARTLRKVVYYFGHALDYIVPGEVGGLSMPTEIRDARSGRILRPGSTLSA
ncbi:MAG: L-threonylcarbamoyladenylate synthase [Gammaproteobacteria bacterium]